MPPPEIHHISHSQVYLVTISATKVHIFFQSAKFSDKFFTNCCVSCATDEPTGASRAYLIYNSREGAAEIVRQEDEGEWSEGRRLYQNGIMDEKTLPVVPSFWKEGLGVVEKNKVRLFS